MGLSATHTYVICEVSASTYNEIAEKLRNAGYEHAFGEDGEIDMHGIAIQRTALNPEAAWPFPKPKR